MKRGLWGSPTGDKIPHSSLSLGFDEVCPIITGAKDALLVGLGRRQLRAIASEELGAYPVILYQGFGEVRSCARGRSMNIGRRVGR
jgi:hypothetical protein